ncbi:NAD(P)-dependent glycerol-3-phosphate dehydrogenase [Methylophilaceae bacterium]|nr:NAD(P)-dependent glycerol-3-phosphate dehydrogenase [Methylophilaceae bacterium]|tara:strand:- start:383 stop:1402 length:1020 start_codon:yes stop_codon:yes gene_type:complete
MRFGEYSLRICVLGAGAWGTALAIHLSKLHPTKLWARDSGHVSGMKKAKSNPLYLGDFKFPSFLEISDDINFALSDIDIIVCAVPTAGFRKILKLINEINQSAPVIWANKGLEQGSAKLPHEIAFEELGDPKKNNRDWGVVSGPSFAAELVRSLPTALTLATTSKETTIFAANIFHHHNLRVYTSQDVVGASVGGALKNVIAIASGISDGMGFGNNARAALITRGLAEISRFGSYLGANPDTFSGLAGSGDLVLTCTGEYSRNREVGIQLAKGETLKAILSNLGHVAEGVYTATEVIRRIDNTEIEMPITSEVNNVVQLGKPPKDAVFDLLGRSIKPEN